MRRTHVDGSGRCRLFGGSGTRAYYRVVQEFGERDRRAGGLNTSFNLRGEPIVTTPAEPLNTFANIGLDALVMGIQPPVKEEMIHESSLMPSCRFV